MASPPSSLVIGLMSGTSLDGIDAALIKIEENGQEMDIELIHYLSESYSVELKRSLADLCAPDTAHIENIAAMNMYLGEIYSSITLKLIEESGFSKEDILLISSHGQTIYHQPLPIKIEQHDIVTTLQIGDISVIAERTGIMTVGDFRTRDIAAGGQGAPLVPYADFLLFRAQSHGSVLVNIGGIANITVIPKAANEADIFAYDTGPGNMIIDAFTIFATNGEHTYDKDGTLASEGNINEEWLERLLKHDYFQLKSPKSTGREMFGFDFAQSLWNDAELLAIPDHDKIATITDLTAKTITDEINNYINIYELREVLISGGGRYNETLMKRITFHLPETITVMGTEKRGIDPDAKEAIIFALLGYQCCHKRTNNLPSATGAKHAVVMGKIAW